MLSGIPSKMRRSARRRSVPALSRTLSLCCIFVSATAARRSIQSCVVWRRPEFTSIPERSFRTLVALLYIEKKIFCRLWLKIDRLCFLARTNLTICRSYLTILCLIVVHRPYFTIQRCILNIERAAIGGAGRPICRYHGRSTSRDYVEDVPIRPIDAWVIAAFLNYFYPPQPLCQPIEIPCRANRQPEPGR